MKVPFDVWAKLCDNDIRATLFALSWFGNDEFEPERVAKLTELAEQKDKARTAPKKHFWQR